jgi:hypothetical protein
LPELHFAIFFSLEGQTYESNSSFWGMGQNPMVPNQDYNEGDEKSPSTKYSRGSLWEPGHSNVMHSA